MNKSELEGIYFVNREIRASRRKKRILYRCFLVFLLLVGLYINSAMFGDIGTYLLLALSAILVYMEVHSELFGRENYISGYLSLDPKPSEVCAQIGFADAGIPPGKREFKFESNAAVPIVTALISLLPLSGYIKDIVQLNSNTFTVYHCLPIIAMGICAKVIYEYYGRLLIVTDNAIFLREMFRDRVISIDSVSDIYRCQFASRHRRYYDYLVICTDTQKVHLGAEDIIDYPVLLQVLSARTGKAIGY